MSDGKTEVDEKILSRLKNRIIVKENENLKTKKMNNAEMVNWIKKLIVEEIQCRSKK